MLTIWYLIIHVYNSKEINWTSPKLKWQESVCVDTFGYMYTILDTIVYSGWELVQENTLKWQTCTNCFCHRKCTVAAAHNLSVHKLQKIMLHRKYIPLKAYWSTFCSNACGNWRASCWNVICNYMMYTTEVIERKLTSLSTRTYYINMTCFVLS